MRISHCEAHSEGEDLKMTRPFLNNQLSVISEKSMDFDCVVTIDIQNDQNDNILERLSLISSKHSESEEDVYTNEQIL